MSTNQPNVPVHTNAQPVGTSTLAVIGGYVLPVLTLIGLFACIITKTVQSDVALPLIAGIVGVHGGAVVTNAAKG